jgi:hypothetical protein
MSTYRRPDGFRFRCSYQRSAYFDHVRTGREYRYDSDDPTRTLMSYDVPAPDDVQTEWREYRRRDYAAFLRWVDDRGYRSTGTDAIIAEHYPDVIAELERVTS